MELGPHPLRVTVPGLSRPPTSPWMPSSLLRGAFRSFAWTLESAAVAAAAAVVQDTPLLLLLLLVAQLLRLVEPNPPNRL